MLVCVATPAEGRLLQDHRVLVTGIGPVRAAHAITRALEREPAKRVVVCGIGGAYPGSGLAVGDVACADTECLGDFGADSPDGFLDLFQEPVLACTLHPCEPRVPFVTVMTCTGTDARAAEIEARTGGAVESMEGAAIVQVCLAYGIPVGEVRGISNMVGHRDRASWRIDDAAVAAQEALLRWIA